MTSRLRGHVGKSDVFKPNARVIHFLNGMLHIEANGHELRPFSPDYYSRNVCPFVWDENAECPRFLNDLVKSALPDDDVDLLQRMLGSCLLGHNIAQKFLMLMGTPGGGKSTVVTVAEFVVGLKNVQELRPRQLESRFDLSRFIGKTTLTGKDVAENFFETPVAKVFLSLVGGDLHVPEFKCSNEKDLSFHGKFHGVVTSNSRLRFRLQGDEDAWARRAVIIYYERPKPKVVIGDFAEQLVTEEGSGICRWLVEGAKKYLRECDSGGGLQLNDNQKKRVTDLIAESNSLKLFVREQVQLTDDKTKDVTTEEITHTYAMFSHSQGWQPMPIRKIERALPDLMLDTFGVSLRHGIVRDGKNRRGYKGIVFIE